MHQKFSTRPLFLQVRDALAARILNGEWGAGQPLPNEVQLASDLGVSQGTVRRALDQLEDEMVVSRRQGRGTFVIDHDSDELAIRFSSIYNEHNQKIAGVAKILDSSVDKPVVAEQAKLQISAHDDILRVERLRLYREHVFLTEVARLALRRFPRISTDGLGDYRISALAQRHGIIVDRVMEEVCAVPCPERAAEQLGIAVGTPVLLLNRLAISDKGVPLEWRTAWCYLREKRYISVQR